jgi:hypothetical protein
VLATRDAKSNKSGEINGSICAISHFDYLLLGPNETLGEDKLSTPKREGFISLLSAKIKAIDAARDEDSESERARKKRAASVTTRHLKKERRKRHLRSRNQIVDEWLRADQVTLGPDVERVDDDAYADLEDFIEEG